MIKLSEDYKSAESECPPLLRPLSGPNRLAIAVKEEETTLTTYLVGPESEIGARSDHGGRSEAGTLVEERRTTEVFQIPPPPPGWAPPPGWQPPPPANFEVIRDTKIVERRSPSPQHHHHHGNAIIVDAGRPPYEVSDPIPVGPLALAVPRHSSRDERAIREEIKALELEKEALRIQRRAEKDLRKADRIRRGHRASETDLVLYEEDRHDRRGEEVIVVRKEKISEPEGVVRIEKDRKGRTSISVPKYIK